MKRTVLALLLVFTVSTQAASFRERVASFCARYLVAEHPYQVSYKKATTTEVVLEYRRQAGRASWGRLDSEDIDEYEMILSILSDRMQGDLSESERVLVEDAVRDYPDPRLNSLLP